MKQKGMSRRMSEMGIIAIVLILLLALTVRPGADLPQAGIVDRPGDRPVSCVPVFCQVARQAEYLAWEIEQLEP